MSDAAAASGDAWLLRDMVVPPPRALRSSLREDAPPGSPPMVQAWLLHTPAREPGLGVGELAERQHLARNTLSDRIQQMPTVGLQQRRPPGSDRRAVDLSPADRGDEERRVRRGLEALRVRDRKAVGHALPALHSSTGSFHAEAGISGAALKAGAGR